jgi:inorganic pyrophosphatase
MLSADEKESNMPSPESISDLLGLMFQSHPWHGVSIGGKAPGQLTAYIEIVPTDTVKYELDKLTGRLKLDRPQKFSNVCPTLYGFVPQTFCAERLAELTRERTGRVGVVGDEDPLDVCVLTEKAINHGDILLQVAPIGGLRMLDGAEADDKLIAVMLDDAAYGSWKDIADCPTPLISRLKHYFLTYKQPPDSAEPRCEVLDVYGREEAFEVIRRCREDYEEHFGNIEERLISVLRR